MSLKERAAKALQEVKKDLAADAESVVPWFYENMHDYYFKTHSEKEQIEHLHAIISGQVTSHNQTVVLKSPCGTRVTYITPGKEGQGLVHVLEQLRDVSLQTARIYSSFDGSLRLDSFHMAQDSASIDRPQEPILKSRDVVSRRLISPELAHEFSDFLCCATPDYVEKFDPGRAARHFRIVRKLGEEEDVQVQLEKNVYRDQDRITVAMINPLDKGMLLEAVKVMIRNGLDIFRMYLDLFQRKDRVKVLIISAYVRQDDRLGLRKKTWQSIARDLAFIKWYHSGTLEWFADEKGWSLKKVSLLQGACKYAYQFLSRQTPYVYSSDRIARTVLNHHELTGVLVTYFLTRFDPELKNREKKLRPVEKEIQTRLPNLPEGPERSTLEHIYVFFRTCLKTNYFRPDPFGLAFRMDSSSMEIIGRELPYGVFFFQGPAFQGFHVRYRDMARGGVRIVRTRTVEQYELESNRLLKEVTDLAESQQYKNKDIPEGGAKAVLLLRPYAHVDIAVKSMTESLLDLILSTKESTCPSYVVDYLGEHEIIYLGPDENITDDHITWMVRQAEKRGYSWPSALMSSKPGAGINHKQYGVTSIGVVVFMEEGLKTLNINPYQDDFRVKITGGPAGDVAGNAMRIMIEQYGSRARIVGVSDGHGAAFDPQGLDQGELLRLVRGGQSIHRFDPAKISGEDGFVVDASDPEGARIRNELHNTVEAEVFLPAGGRPDTINAGNWERFLGPGGKPSARAIVEGANIFISDQAREELEKSGVLFFHGSSANKTGVITSSYEILAGLILTSEEFMDIKGAYVDQVLDILRNRARAEARLILREHRYSGKKRPLSHISFAISREINDLGDTIGSALFESVTDLHSEESLCRLLLDYCPAVLVTRYQERIIHDIPVRHQFAILGAYISSKIVYSDGPGWLKRMVSLRDINEVIDVYLREEKLLKDYITGLEQSGLPGREEMARVLKARGRRFLTAEKLGLESEGDDQ